jgi:ketosteroid isomerase-like protein
MRRSLQFVIHAAPVVLLLAACAGAGTGSGGTPRPTSPADRALIREARIAQNHAMATGDIERAAAFWTDDVSLRRGLGQLINGKAEYRKLLVPAGHRDSTLVYIREPNGIDVSPNWPLAFETGAWTGHMGAPNGPALIGGRYSAQWVKRAGRWLIRSEVFVALTCSGVGCRSGAVP